MSDKTILITRPAREGEELTEALHGLGFRVIHEPMTDILLRHDARPAIERAIDRNPDGIILTSRHGALALAALSELRDLPLLCVGEATADAARSMGFSRVSAAGGDVEQVEIFVSAAYDEGTRFLYPSADEISADLPAILAARGMEVERVVVYEAAAATGFSDTLTEQLKRGQISAVTFLSRRAAQIFSDLLDKTGLAESAQTIQVCCLSDAIAEVLTHQWHGITAADEPTLASLVECVDNTVT